MSFADKIAALRDFVKPPADAALPLQVAMMNEQMGIRELGGRRLVRGRDRERQRRSAQDDGR